MLEVLTDQTNGLKKADVWSMLIIFMCIILHQHLWTIPDPKTGPSSRMLTRSQLQPQSDLGLFNKLIGSTSRPLHAPSTPSRSTANNTLPSHTAYPPSHPPHSCNLLACPHRRFLFPTSSVRGSLAHSLWKPCTLIVEALHTHRGSLAHSSWMPPSLCLDIIPYSSRCPAMTPNVRYLPFYLSLLLLLWSPILPEPQACLATPHHFLDLAYTLFPLQVPITQLVSLHWRQRGYYPGIKLRVY